MAVHESAHAVVFELLDIEVVRVVVCPRQAENLTSGNYDAFVAVQPATFDAEFKQYLTSPGPREKMAFWLPFWSNSRAKAATTQRLFAELCGRLAGPLASCIQAGTPCTLAGLLANHGNRSDIVAALSYAKLLFEPNAFDRAILETENLLRRRWSLVERVAAAARETGSLDRAQMEALLY